jgi:hypothetical protein
MEGINMFTRKTCKSTFKMQVQFNEHEVSNLMKVLGTIDKEVGDFIHDVNRILDTSKSPFTIKEVCK